MWPSMNLESWQQQGNPTPKKMLTEYTKTLQEKASKPDQQIDDIISRGEDYINRSLLNI